MGMGIEQQFVGGSLDGRTLQVEVGLRSFRVPKPMNNFLADQESDPLSFDVETYIYDLALGKFVEEHLASSDAISWQTFETRRAIGDLLTSDKPEVIEMGKRHFHQEFDAYIGSEVIKMAQKVGLKLEAVKYLLDKTKELTERNKWLEQENARLNEWCRRTKAEIVADALKATP